MSITVLPTLDNDMRLARWSIADRARDQRLDSFLTGRERFRP